MVWHNPKANELNIERKNMGYMPIIFPFFNPLDKSLCNIVVFLAGSEYQTALKKSTILEFVQSQDNQIFDESTKFVAFYSLLSITYCNGCFRRSWRFFEY